jgi:hypothetical protein
VRVCNQIFIEASNKHPDANIRRHYEIQKASWVWHPDCLQRGQSSILIFKCLFKLAEKTTFRIHMSADNRYELSLDDKLISRGPHRCDEFHWSFSSYELTLEKGAHEFNAVCNWLNEEGPVAQRTIGHGGFIFAAEGSLAETLNTGIGKWEVAKWEGWSFERNPLEKKAYCAVGQQFVMNTEAMQHPKIWVAPKSITNPLKDHSTGLIRPKWKLFPTSIPELMYETRAIGKLRGVAAIDYIATELPQNDALVGKWQSLVKDKKPLKIESNSSQKWVVDLEDYYCGYPQVSLNGGAGATVKVLWSEGLYVPHEKIRDKKNRNEINGKIFDGFGDIFIQNGKKTSFKPLWWRSGRYLLIEIETKNEPLVIEEFSIIESRYPVENKGVFKSSDDSLAGVIPLMVRGLQSCSHETFMDCPYYEQLMYVGDTRIEMLVSYVINKDDRLVKRCIEVFDWSRYSTGYVMERYPSWEEQLSLTFSMIWTLVLRDYAWWRNDKKWVQQRLVGMRCMMENMRVYKNKEGLLENLPGWSFLDWVPGWNLGMHPGVEEGPSSIINLFYVLALQSAADLEQEFGEPILAKRNLDESQIVIKSIKTLFWNSSRSLFADNFNKTSYSEHAQSLALIAGVLEKDEKEKCIKGLLNDTDLCRATVYFSHYLFEALYKIGRADLIDEKLNFWRNMKEIGLKTPLEMPEPTRSDCHAWGAHPLYHYYASLAGIRPSDSGFSKVLIAPQPGKLEYIDCVLPHPLGEIKVNLKFSKGAVNGAIHLPVGLSGNFELGEKKLVLLSGENYI